ncbi:MAG: ISL3 family transposase [Saprospiraceae bacterium]
MVVFPIGLLFEIPGIELSSITLENERAILQIGSTGHSSPCPKCNSPSFKVHSRYNRTISDLPLCGISAEARLRVRKFLCISDGCKQKVFSERFSHFVNPYGRRTIRLDQRLTTLGLKAGGNLGASIAMLMGISISSSTILRLIFNTEEAEIEIPRVLGIDDWAFKKGRNYGTILVDLERQQPIELLPDRESETVRKWLTEHPGVEIISRDRGGDYAKGSREGAPQAIQVADRWHLLKNLGDALYRMMNKHNRELRQVAQQVAQSEEITIENQQNESEGQVKTDSTNKETPSKHELNFQEVKRLQAEGQRIRAIYRITGLHRQTIKKYFQYDTYPDGKGAPSSASCVHPYGQHIRKRWYEGENNHVKLLEEIKAMGYAGSFSSLYRYTRQLPQGDDRRDAEKMMQAKAEVWSSRKAARLLSKHADSWTGEEKKYLEALFKLCPNAEKARGIAIEFQDMMKLKKPELLDSWIEDAIKSDVENLKRFAKGIQQDYDAVKAALTLAWSNGQVEGQVNRLKTLKRQMYGRAGFKLLRKRILFRSG